MATTEVVDIDKPDGVEIICGQGCFNILAIESLFEAIATAAPQAKFGIAFTEGSDAALTRSEGNDTELQRCAVKNAVAIGCGHMFFVAMKGAFPLQVLSHIKAIPMVLNVYMATGNPCKVVVARIGDGAAFLGVADGISTKGVETEEDRRSRKELVRRLGYLTN